MDFEGREMQALNAFEEGQQDHMFLLSGWYDITTLLVDLMLNRPQDADLLRGLIYDVDIVNVVDKLSTSQPTVFWLVSLSSVYLVGCVAGAPAYFYLRSDSKCGGERTQDLTDSYRCVLQVFTLGYIVSFALLFMHILIMICTMHYIRPLVTGPTKAGLFSNLEDLGIFANNISQALTKECDVKFQTLSDFQIVATSTRKGGLADALYNFLLPIMQQHTRRTFSHLHEYAELALAHDTVFGMMQAQRQSKAEAQQKFVRFVADSVASSYDGRIRYIVNSIPSIVNNTSVLRVAIIKDSLQYKSSLDKFVSHVVRDSTSSVTSVFTRFVYLSSTAVMMAIILALLYMCAFTAGIVNHDARLAPTKRSHRSDNAGLVLLIIGITAVFNVFIVGYAMVAMVIGSTSYAYLCGPTSILTIDPLDSTSQAILDQVWDVVWPKDTRGVLFRELSPGTAFALCQGSGRYMQIAPENVKKELYALRDSTAEVIAKLSGITVDVDALLNISTNAKRKLGIPATTYDDFSNVMKVKLISLISDWAEFSLGSLHSGPADEDKVNLPCEPVFRVYRQAFGSFCGLTLKNFNAWWLAMYFCVVLLSGLVILSHYTTKYFLKMVNYTQDGSEVESSSAVVQITDTTPSTTGTSTSDV
ncbi:uncharacterized protein LOC135388129 isoform X2 [Ornithodoros turicata]|uniref:uncharacterized protein LOC135388129 isoform X2 n=1 Tax=Ornithodoros turicata TaxID=34597 RepID=UPI0031392BC0